MKLNETKLKQILDGRGIHLASCCLPYESGYRWFVAYRGIGGSVQEIEIDRKAISAVSSMIQASCIQTGNRLRVSKSDLFIGRY